MLLRDKDIFDVSQLEYAIIEPNGKLSLLRKPQYDQVIKKDLSIFSQEVELPIVIFLEKKIIKESLNYLNISEIELMNLLKSNGYQNFDDLFVVTLTKNQKIHISTYLVNESISIR